MDSTLSTTLPSASVQASVQANRDQFIVVTCYTRFDNLAHGPKGTEAKHCAYTFWLDPNDGQMVLLSVSQDQVMNPAFSRFHPTKNVLYMCTESVAENGQIISWDVHPNGKLTLKGSFDAGGTSTCYITLDQAARNMLIVNYWDATIPVLQMDPTTGSVVKQLSCHDPKGGKQMVARHDKHVNHSENDANAQKDRQSDPHSHAVILDPIFGRIAYVPDLGMDVVRQFLYDEIAGTLTAAGIFKSGADGRMALGPRYIEFHPNLPVAYVINELSSEVAVFQFDRTAADDLVRGGASRAWAAMPTLKLVQTILTIPEGFPLDMNTCGRITVHATGNFVLCSNRGHDSIVVFRVHTDAPTPGLLSVACVQHTRGATPRHFQFDASGQWLVAANQDSDSLGVFQFNMATGSLEWTNHKYSVPSPNFVCSVRPHIQSAFIPARL